MNCSPKKGLKYNWSRHKEASYHKAIVGMHMRLRCAPKEEYQEGYRPVRDNGGVTNKASRGWMLVTPGWSFVTVVAGDLALPSPSPSHLSHFL